MGRKLRLVRKMYGSITTMTVTASISPFCVSSIKAKCLLSFRHAWAPTGLNYCIWSKAPIAFHGSWHFGGSCWLTSGKPRWKEIDTSPQADGACRASVTSRNEAKILQSFRDRLYFS